MQLQRQDRVGSTAHLSIFKFYFIVTALRFNQTHVQACGRSCSDLFPLAESLLLSQPSSWMSFPFTP